AAAAAHGDRAAAFGEDAGAVAGDVAEEAAARAVAADEHCACTGRECVDTITGVTGRVTGENPRHGIAAGNRGEGRSDIRRRTSPNNVAAIDVDGDCLASATDMHCVNAGAACLISTRGYADIARGLSPNCDVGWIDVARIIDRDVTG